MRSFKGDDRVDKLCVCVGGEYNDGISSWEEVETSHIRNAINLQPEIHKEIVKNEGGATVYLYSNAQRKE